MTAFFDMIPEQDQPRIRRLMERRRYEPDEVVFHQGDGGSGLHVIETGWFLVQAVTSTSGRVGMTIEGPGDVFGDLALRERAGGRAATIRALRPAETLCLDVANVDELRRITPEMDRFLVVLLADRLDRLTTQLADTAWTPAGIRVCQVVALLAQVFDGGPIHLKQEELASLAHTTRPTVSTALNRLARDGIVSTGRAQFRVLDLPGLVSRCRQ